MSTATSSSVSVNIFPTDERVVVLFNPEGYRNQRCVKVYLNVGSSDLRHLIDLTSSAALELADSIIAQLRPAPVVAGSERGSGELTPPAGPGADGEEAT